MNDEELRQFLRDRGVPVPSSLICPQLTEDQKHRLQKLCILLQDKNKTHHPIVRRINRWGIIYRFGWRITHSKIPQPDLCIEMIEKKLLGRL